MGRRKIAMKPIQQGSSRRATFEKRRIGLLKKAMELSILCSSTVSVTIYNPDGDVYVYSSEPYENVVNKFREYSGNYKLLTNDHYDKMVPGKASSSNIGYSLIKQAESKLRNSQQFQRLSQNSIPPATSTNIVSPTLFPPEIDENISQVKQEPIDVDKKTSNSASRNSEKSNHSNNTNNSRKRNISEVLDTDILPEDHHDDHINLFDSDKSTNSKTFGFINTIAPIDPINITKDSNFGQKRIKLTKDFDSLDLNYHDLHDPHDDINNQHHTNHVTHSHELDIKDNSYLIDPEINLESINQSQFIL